MSKQVLTVNLSFPAALRGLGMGEGGYKIARSLQAEGATVRIICAGPPNPTLDPTLFQSVKYVEIKRWMRLWVRSPLRIRGDMGLNLSNNLFDGQARWRVGASEIFYGYTEASLWTMGAARRKGARTVLHAANSHIANLRELLGQEAVRWGQPGTLVNGISQWKIEAEYRRADFIRTQSRWVYETLVERGVPEEKLFWIPPAVDLERYQPATTRPEQFTVGFVGSFDLRKGIQYLLPAWSKFALRHPEARLIMHGGSGSRFINRLLGPYQENPSIEWADGPGDPTFARSSVCIVPSVEDGFCYVVLEALASGVPVILTQNVGAKDLIEDGTNGFIIPIRDEAALVERLEWLYDHPDQLAEMSRAARAKAEQYTYQREGAALIEQFRRILG